MSISTVALILLHRPAHQVHTSEYKLLLESAGRPAVLLLPVVISCLPAASDTTINRFEVVSVDAKTFVARATLRRNSAITLGRTRDCTIVEAWLKQHSVIDLGCVYVSAYLKATSKEEPQSVMQKDALITIAKDMRRAVSVYHMFVRNTTSNLSTIGLDPDSQQWKDIVAANEEANGIITYLDAQYLTSWTKSIQKKCVDMQDSLKVMCGGESSLKALVDVHKKEDIERIVDDFKFEFSMQQVAIACRHIDNTIKRAESYIDGYDELSFSVTTDKGSVSVTQFLSQAKVSTARGKMAVCAGSLWELVLDDIPSLAQRKNDVDKQKKDIVANIDEERQPFPAKLLLMMDNWATTGDVCAALEQINNP